MRDLFAFKIVAFSMMIANCLLGVNMEHVGSFIGSFGARLADRIAKPMTAQEWARVHPKVLKMYHRGIVSEREAKWNTRANEF